MTQKAARFEDLITALLKIQFFWDATLCLWVASEVTKDCSAFETSGTIYPTTELIIPEDFNIQHRKPLF
jgi:hypothetical protein